MCKSWRRTKTCPRLDKGKPCGYTHPADRTLTTKQCNAFRDTGFCAQGELCRYPHLMPASSSPAPALASSPAPASAPTPPAPSPTPPASAPSSTLPSLTSAVLDLTQQGQTDDAETGAVSSSQQQPTEQPMPSPASLTPPSTPSRSSRSSHAASSIASASASKKRKLGLDDYLQPTRGQPWHEMSEEEEEEDRGKATATLHRTPSSKTSRAAAASLTPTLPSSSLSLLSSPEPRPPIAASSRQLSARRSLFPQETTSGQVLQRSASTSSSFSAAAAPPPLGWLAPVPPHAARRREWQLRRTARACTYCTLTPLTLLSHCSKWGEMNNHPFGKQPSLYCFSSFSPPSGWLCGDGLCVSCPSR
jgi:hypothetical protein